MWAILVTLRRWRSKTSVRPVGRRASTAGTSCAPGDGDLDPMAVGLPISSVYRQANVKRFSPLQPDYGACKGWTPATQGGARARAESVNSAAGAAAYGCVTIWRTARSD